MLMIFHASIGPLILLIFFGMLVFGYVYVFFFIPEVKGLSLEEVDELYRSGIKPWNSSSFVPEDKHLVHHEKIVINEDVREDKGKSGL